jgi:hypothetical protein
LLAPRFIFIRDDPGEELLHRPNPLPQLDDLVPELLGADAQPPTLLFRPPVGVGVAGEVVDGLRLLVYGGLVAADSRLQLFLLFVEFFDLRRFLVQLALVFASELFL